MRLALINNFYPPFVVGGAELFTSNLAEALSSRGHEVAVVTTCAPDNQQRQEKLNGVDVFRFFQRISGGILNGSRKVTTTPLT